MRSYDDFEREVLAHQHQLLSELSSMSPARARTRRRGQTVARVLRSLADRLDPETSRDLSPFTPR
ncbi:MAG: hypothetical protein QOK05_1568 [Chloroflexota bacterium]|jgi:hypothetical protein|nr:hypothetical protein [Chloroflexota bacterium]